MFSGAFCVFTTTALSVNKAFGELTKNATITNSLTLLEGLQDRPKTLICVKPVIQNLYDTTTHKKSSGATGPTQQKVNFPASQMKPHF